MRSRDDAEQALTLVSAEATRGFLSRVLAAARSVISTGQMRPGVQPVVALGTLFGWWTEVVDEKIVLSIRSAWSGAFAVSLAGEQVISPRADAMSFHLAAVRDRLSRTATPEIPEAAFEQVRLSQSAAALQGWGIDQQARDIAERLAWESNKDHWKQVKAEAEAAIDAVLDPLGKPGTPARTYAHKNDPTVKFWQEVRAEAVDHLRADESVWKTRAERIARTEATAAWNSGALAALAAEGRSHKMWLATTDARTRPEHVLADRQVVPMSSPFRVGGSALMMPGDPTAPPHLTVNCRCTVIGADAPTAPVLDTDSRVAAGGGGHDGWRDQLRIPKGNGRRSGRWTFTPWKHLDDLAAVLGALGANSEPDTRSRVAGALDALSPFNAADVDVHDRRLGETAREIASSLQQAQPENEDVREAVDRAAEGIRLFGDTDWSLFGESSDIGASDDRRPALGGRATNKHVWEGDLPSDEAVDEQFADTPSEWLARELQRIKDHPVAPSPTARRKRAAYVKELSDRRDRDERALTPEPEVDETEDSLETVRADVAALADARNDAGLEAQPLFDVLWADEPATPQALFDALNALPVDDDSAGVVDALQERLRALGAGDGATPQPQPLVEVESPTAPEATEIVKAALRSALTAGPDTPAEVRTALANARAVLAQANRAAAGSPDQKALLREIADHVQTAANAAPENSALRRGLEGDAETLRGLGREAPKMTRVGTDTAVPEDLSPVLDKWVKLRGSGTLTPEERARLGQAVQEYGVRAPTLFRGASLPESVVSGLRPGQRLEFGPSSASEDLDAALPYAEFADDTPVVFEFEGARGLDVQQRALDVAGYAEREWITGGEMFVQSTYEEEGVTVAVLGPRPPRGRAPLNDTVVIDDVVPRVETPGPGREQDTSEAAAKHAAVRDVLSGILETYSSSPAAGRLVAALTLKDLPTYLEADVANGEVSEGFSTAIRPHLDKIVHLASQGTPEQFRDAALDLQRQLDREGDLAPGRWVETAAALVDAPWTEGILHKDELAQRSSILTSLMVTAGVATEEPERLEMVLQEIFDADLDSVATGDPLANAFAQRDAMRARRAVRVKDPDAFMTAMLGMAQNFEFEVESGEPRPESLRALGAAIRQTAATWEPLLRERSGIAEQSIREEWGEIPEARRDPASVVADVGWAYGGRARNSNCVLASAVFEARRRGLDVQPRQARDGRPSFQTYAAWFTVNRDDVSYIEGLRGRQAKGKYAAIERHFTERPDKYPPGSRGTIDVAWSGRNSGHIWNWEVDEAGQVYFYDAQTGESRIPPTDHMWGDISGAHEPKVIRLDHRQITDHLKVAFAPSETSEAVRHIVGDRAQDAARLRNEYRTRLAEWAKANDRQPSVSSSQWDAWRASKAALHEAYAAAQMQWHAWQNENSDVMELARDESAFPYLSRTIYRLEELP